MGKACKKQKQQVTTKSEKQKQVVNNVVKTTSRKTLETNSKIKQVVKTTFWNTLETSSKDKNNCLKTQTLQISKLNFSKSKKIYQKLIVILMRGTYGKNQKQQLPTIL